MIKKILKKYIDEYKFLYNNNDNVAGFREALEDGLKWIESRPALLTELCKARQDIFTSDREIAALAFTLADFGLI